MLKNFFSIFLSSSLLLKAAVDIGNESFQAFPTDASYSGTIAYRPFNGSTQYLNPPIFSWSAKVNFLGPASGSVTTDPFFPEYQLVISTNANLGTPIINKRVISNMENRFYPFTNSNGSINSNLIYWSVALIATNNTTNKWITTNSFRISAAATNWPRGLLADEVYLAAPTHPYMLFTPTNRAAAYQFYQTNDTYTWNQSHLLHLAQFTNSGQAWPSNTVGWSTNGNWAIVPAGFVYPTNVNVNFVAFYEALLHYAMTNDSNLKSLLVNQYSNCVNWALGVNYAFNDVGSGDGTLVFNILYYGFDWLYNDLDATTKSQAILFGERYCKWTMRSISWGGASWVDGYDTNYTLNSMQQMWFALSEEGTSHNNIQFALAADAALAFYQHGTNSRAMFDAGINWLIARGNFTGGFAAINQGRGYATVGNGVMVSSMIDYDRVFPENTLYKIPMLKGFSTWMFDITPPGWREYHGQQGDGGNNGIIYSAMEEPYFGQLLALFSRDGNVVRAYNKSLTFYNPSGSGEPILVPQIHTIWPPVSETTNYEARAYLEDGWIIANTKPLNSVDAFTNSVGYILVGRPRASESGHSTMCDGDIEIWAYGCKVTDSGSINLNTYGYLADSHNMPKFNGIGSRNRYYYGDAPVLPYYSKVLTYTNTTDFTYSAVDISLSYTNDYGIDNGTNVVKAIRHSLLCKAGGYIAIYDDMQTVTNGNFAVNYVILENGLTNITGTSFRFGSTNYNGQTISNHFFQIASGFTITNMTGSNVTRNPITGVYTDDSTSPLWKNHVWFRSGDLTNVCHSLLVIAPQYVGSNAPVVTTLDENTFKIVFNGVTETNTFGTNYTGAYTRRISTLNGVNNDTNLPPVASSGVVNQFQGKQQTQGKVIIR